MGDCAPGQGNGGYLLLNRFGKFRWKVLCVPLACVQESLPFVRGNEKSFLEPVQKLHWRGWCVAGLEALQPSFQLLGKLLGDSRSEV